jgi:hypothetical protein
LLTNASILRIANPNEYFVVCTNACKEGFGGILTQNGHVILYESINLKEHERHYSTHNLELEAIFHALKMWTHYLMGIKFELKTEQCSLKHFFGQPTLNARQVRWLEFLNEYDFDINHIRWKQSKVVDELNKKVH